MQQDNDIDIIMSYQHALICRCPKWDTFKTKDFYFYHAGNSGSLTWVAVLQVHAGSFRASVIHLTLAWTTGYLLCVRVICIHAYTHGLLGTPTASQHNIRSVSAYCLVS